MDQQQKIEAIKNMLVLGKPARDFDLQGCTSVEELQNWCSAFWEAMNKLFPKSNEINGLDDVFGKPFRDALLAKTDELQRIASLNNPVHVAEQEYKAILKFDVYHCGWESDAEGSVVETPEGRKLVLTNHGQPYFADAKELQNYIREYSNAIDKMELALALLKE
ncbi:MAG: hypothetical protein RSG77_21845 [Hafnia sp.]